MEKTTVLKRIIANVERVIVDKRFQVELILVALLARGHVLIEDIPGVGKTSLASALAKSINCSFSRIQFTPDIMPTDITGFSVFNPKTGDFEYRKGAILSQIVLADEINRTSPKTQSSLLEAMEEKQVTVDGVTYKMGSPFMVIATQNPVDYLGTYPLPEAQIDRFFMRISIGYPSKSEEIGMLSRFGKDNPLERLESVAMAEKIAELQRMTDQVYVDKRINEYIINLVRHTRENEFVELGASPRAAISLYKASQAWALYNDRGYVIPDDVICMCPHVISHRVMLKQEGKLKKITQKDVVKDAINDVLVPVIQKW